MSIDPKLQKLNQEHFRELIRKNAERITSADYEGWTKENPLWGHCAVVALLAQDIFGGTLLRASLEDTPFAKMRSHYCNKISTDEVIDFTDEQFGDNKPTNLVWEHRERSVVINPAATSERYTRLRLAILRDLENQPTKP